MALSPDVESTYCVVWRTKRPFGDTSRQSSRFPLLGSEWYLLFQLLDIDCEISLIEGSNTKTFSNSICVEFLIGMEGTSKRYGGSKSGESSLPVLFMHDFAKTVQTLGCPDDSVWTITCLFPGIAPPRLMSETVHLTTQTDFEQPSRLTSDLESLSHDLSALLERNIFPDVHLRCGGRTFSAHRSILAARSEVFAAMFRNKMAESETGTVDVTDMDAEALDVLLKYVYSGKLPDLYGVAASSLYVAGDKYRIQALREACSELMEEELTPDNCLSFLVLADARSDEAFKDRVGDFVAQNLELLKKEAWFEFNKVHTLLAHSVYHKRFAASLLKQA